MAKILLISANTYVYPYPVYPIGMAAISAALKKNNHTVLQYDCLFPNKSLRETIAEFNPNIVGISVRNIDNEDYLAADNHWSCDVVKNLIREIKSVNNIPVFLGGAGFSVVAEKFLDYANADFGIVGAGEKSVQVLVSNILSGENIKENIFSSQGFDSALEPDIDKNLLQKYMRSGGLLGVLTKRGCAYKCGYCSYPSIDGRKFAAFEVKTIVGYIKKLQQEMGVNEIFFTDSVFNDSCGYACDLCREIISQNVKIKFAAYFNPANVSFEDLKLFKEAGLFAVELGTDAACDTTLNALKKTFKFDDVLKFQSMCDDLRLPCSHFIIFGGPDETYGTIQESLDNIKKINNGVVMVFSGVRVHYNTEIYNRALKEGKLTKDTNLLKPYYYFSDKINISKMNDMILQSFKGNRKRIFPPEKGEEMMRTLRGFGYKGLLWDTLIKF
ncbi:lipid biosynthesis B12-binding/radical SAM protein [Endomicrobium proavitum]|nr:lipid biosynthesis B12-binding/radical SAM protein [Endomicrobium proavitum]